MRGWITRPLSFNNSPAPSFDVFDPFNLFNFDVFDFWRASREISETYNRLVFGACLALVTRCGELQKSTELPEADDGDVSRGFHFRSLGVTGVDGTGRSRASEFSSLERTSIALLQTGAD